MNNTDIDCFAPVIIPTLCRYEHFKKSIESLMKCTHAEKTDVYIGLDFPNKDIQWNGYRKISAYLDILEKEHKFRSLTVFRREQNYGLGKNGNARQLRNYVLSKYDRYIFSEDDNEFAPSFLDYINKGLSIFKDDKSVFAICGYRHFFQFKFSQNTFFRENVDFNAWGYGIWKDRIKFTEHIDTQWFNNRLSIKSFLNIKRDNGNDRCYHFYTFAHTKNLLFTDIVCSVFLYLSKFDVIMPRVSLVRNLGMDRSGENFRDIKESLSNKYSKQELSPIEVFDFEGSGFENYDENRQVFKNEGLGNYSSWNLLINIIKFTLKNIRSTIK